MKRVMMAPCILLLLVAQHAAVASAADALDLRRGVPDDVYLVIRATHNPERDYQKQYYEEVWKTVQETQILDRALKIITSRLEEDQLSQASSVIDELREATKPIDIEALSNCQELIYAQQMLMTSFGPQAPTMPLSQHLALLRLTPEVAASTAEGIQNLFKMAEKYSGGQVTVQTSNVGDAVLTTLVLPPQSPMQPTIATIGDVFIFCSSKTLLEKSLGMMTSTQGKSKFDDPRLIAALKKLPAPEDSLVFYDGKTQFATLQKIGPAIAQIGGGDPNVEQVVKIIDMIMKDVSILDYEVTVEYTEGNLNRSASFGKLMPNTADSTLRTMMTSGQPFEKWQSWVPAGALSYSLGTGVYLHPLYERIMSVLNDLKEDVPDIAEGLEQFEQIQQQFDLHLDEDILQSFTGEHASVSVPTGMGNPDSVTALRCPNPDRIKELIHRGMEALQQIPQVQAQQLKMVECKELKGFEEISYALAAVTGVRPVIGFQDGWMYIGSSTKAIQQVLDTQAGKGETIENTDAFKRLSIEVEGPVDSIKYTNTAESTRAMARALTQAGTMAPMIMAMAGANAGDDSLQPIQEVLALLPDLSKIVAKFDFLEANITVIQGGDEPDSYTKRGVTVVRAPEAEANTETSKN